MIKTAIASGLTLLLFLSTAPQSDAQEMKVASLNVREVFDGWDFAEKEKKRFAKARKALEKENSQRKEVIRDYQSKQDKIYKSKDKLSEEERKELDRKFFNLGRDIVALKQDRRYFYAQSKLDLDKEEAAQSKRLLERISETVQVYALAEKYDMVIEEGGHTTSQLPFFLHLDDAKDITKAIIKRLGDSSDE